MIFSASGTAAHLSPFWEKVDLKPHGEAVIQAIHNGLPYSFFSMLTGYFGLPVKVAAEAAGIPETTLRRRANGRFTTQESDRLYRFAEILATAEAVFGSDVVEGRRWLQTPDKALGGNRPFDRMATSAEVQSVLACLRKLEAGDLS